MWEWRVGRDSRLGEPQRSTLPWFVGENFLAEMGERGREVLEQQRGELQKEIPERSEVGVD